MQLPLINVAAGNFLQSWVGLREARQQGAQLQLEVRVAMLEWEGQDPPASVRLWETVSRLKERREADEAGAAAAAAAAREEELGPERALTEEEEEEGEWALLSDGAPPAGGAAGGALPPEYDHLYCRESGQAPEPLASLLFPLRGAPLQRDSRARARLGSTTWSRTCATSAR